MAFLVDIDTRIVVQGLTGSTGQMAAEMMKTAGAKIVAGVTPGKGGQTSDGVPVFDTVDEAKEAGGTASILFVPAGLLRDAALEALDAGMDPIVLMVDGVPLDISLELVAVARERGVTLIGPNSPGVISPGKSLLGALRDDFYSPGDVALISRSGGMMTTIAYELTKVGIGQSTCVGIGGDPIIGSSFTDLLELFQNDPRTDVIMMIGEIGGRAEEEAAEFFKKRMTKPIVAFIAGQTAPPGRRMGHAGAIIEGSAGTAAEKMKTLQQAGIRVAKSPEALGETVASVFSTIKR